MNRFKATVLAITLGIGGSALAGNYGGGYGGGGYGGGGIGAQPKKPANTSKRARQSKEKAKRAQGQSWQEMRDSLSWPTGDNLN